MRIFWNEKNNKIFEIDLLLEIYIFTIYEKYTLMKWHTQLEVSKLSKGESY